MAPNKADIHFNIGLALLGSGDEAAAIDGAGRQALGCHVVAVVAVEVVAVDVAAGVAAGGVAVVGVSGEEGAGGGVVSSVKW